MSNNADWDKVYSPRNASADVGVLAYWSELRVEHSPGHGIATEQAASGNSSPVLATFLAQSARVSEVVSLAGVEAIRVCFQANGTRNAPLSSELRSRRFPEDIPGSGSLAGPLIPFYGARETTVRSERALSLRTC